MFVDSIAAIWAYTHLLSPIKFFVLLGLIFIAIYQSTPHPDKYYVEPEHQELYFILRACWMGEATLWKAFWPFFILANGVFLYIDFRVEQQTYTISSWRTAHVILFFPMIWWLVSVWKCSANTNKRVWAILYRTLVAYFIFDYALRLYISYEYPYIFFDCELLAIEYGEC